MHPDFVPARPGPQWDTRLSRPLESEPEPSWTFDYPIPADMYEEWRQSRDRRRALWNRMGQQSPMHTRAQPQTPPQQEPPQRSGRVRQQQIIPDNVYGDRYPTDIDCMTQEDWQDLIRNVPVFSRGQPVTPVPQQFPPLPE